MKSMKLCLASLYVAVTGTLASADEPVEGDLTVNQGMVWITDQNQNDGNHPGLGIYGGELGAGLYFRGGNAPGKAFFFGVNEGDMLFATGGGAALTRLVIKDDGNIGVGTLDPAGFKLAVNGAIRAKEVVVDTAWADFVFDPSYALPPLEDVERHIAARGHLPDVPPSAQIELKGLSVGESQRLMMQKIEELTLYAIEQNKRIKALQAEVESLMAGGAR